MSVEGPRAAGRTSFASCAASTEPRSCERGRGLSAAVLLVRLDASTEPRSCERGRMPSVPYHVAPGLLQRSRARVSVEGSLPPPYKVSATSLQRSRARVSVEGRPRPSEGRPRAGASTEPRSCERGRAEAAAIAARVKTASTEPRSCERGRSKKPAACPRARTRFNGAALV